MPLIVGDPIVTDSVIVESGQNIQEGAVLGRVDSSGKFKLCAKDDGNGTDVNDGSQDPYAVALEGVDASGGDKIAPVLLMGQVDINKLSFGSGWDQDSIKVALRGVGIFAKKTL